MKKQEQIDIVRKMIADGVVTQEQAAKYFPELTESEDEKIRKWIIKDLKLDLNEILCKVSGDYDERDADDKERQVYLERALTWLENQGEQKPAWSEEDEKMLSDIVKDLVHPWNEYIPDRIEDEIKWLKNRLKSLRPQSTWKPSDVQMEALVSAIDVMIDNRGAGDKNTILLSGLYHELKAL